MTKGVTTLTFHGGPNDGEVIEDVPGIRVFPLISRPTGSGFAEVDGKVGVFTNAATLPTNWFTFKTAHYAKRGAEPDGPGVHYDFLEVVFVSRCRAVTQKNGWCKNEAVQEQNVCKTHARAANVELKPDLLG